MTYGSLFTGIGGIDLGLDRAGLQCRWQVENDPYAIRVLEKHWPEVKRYGDITKVNGSELESVDLICGGFPCQDLSQAGKRAGIEGTRSGLWFEYARIVGVVRPRFVLIENVPGLLVPTAMSRVVGELARLGYVGAWRSLRASEFGASHLRKRVFIVAYASRYGRVRDAGTGRQEVMRPEHGSLDVAYRDGGRPPIQWRSGLFDGERETRGYDVNGCDPHVAHAADFRPEQLRPLGGSLTAGEGKGRCRPVRRNLSQVRSEDLAYGIGKGLEERGEAGSGSEMLGNAANLGLQGLRADGQQIAGAHGREGLPLRPDGALDFGLQFAPGPSDPRWPFILRERPDLAPALTSFRGVADGISDWMDGAMSNRTKRLGRLGNAVVPQIAEWIGHRILKFEEERT